MEKILTHLDESEYVLEKAKETSGYQELDECQLDILVTPAVDNLGSLSLYAEQVSKTPLAARFQNAAQGLIDFLESRGHGNILKEVSAIDLIKPYYTLRIPKIFDRNPQ